MPADIRTKRSTAGTAEMLVKISEGSARENSHLASVSPNAHAAVRSDFEPARSTMPLSLTGGRTPTLFSRQVSRAPTVLSRNGVISRQDLIKSTEYIFFFYLAPLTTLGEESHEIYLSPTLSINSFPLLSEREPRGGSESSVIAQVPDMFYA